MEIQVKETVHHLLKTLECPICLEVLEDPVSTSCHHQFCRQCIIKVINMNNVKNQSSCPMCKTNISKRGLREKPFLSEILATTKEIAEAIKWDSGIDVSPPKWSSCGRVNVVSHSGSIEAFHLAHPSPYKPSSTGNVKRLIKEHPSMNKRFKSSTIVYDDGNTLDKATLISNMNVSAGFPAAQKKLIICVEKQIPSLLPVIRGKENLANVSSSTFRLDFVPSDTSSRTKVEYSNQSLNSKPLTDTLIRGSDNFDEVKKRLDNVTNPDSARNSLKNYTRKKADKLSTISLEGKELDPTEKVNQWLTTQSKVTGIYLDTLRSDSSYLKSSKKFFKSKSFYQGNQAFLPQPLTEEDPYAFISSQKTQPRNKKGSKTKRRRKTGKNPSAIIPGSNYKVSKLSAPSTSKEKTVLNIENDDDFLPTNYSEKDVKMAPPATKAKLPDSLGDIDDDLDDIVLFQTPACDVMEYSNKNGTYINSDNENNESEFGITKNRSKVGKKGGTVKKSRISKDPNLPSTQEQIDNLNKKLAEAENFKLNIEYTGTSFNEKRVQNSKLDFLVKPDDKFLVGHSETILSPKEVTKSPLKVVMAFEAILSPRKPLGQANRLNEGSVYGVKMGLRKTQTKNYAQVSTPDTQKSLKPIVNFKSIVPLGINTLLESKSTAGNENGHLPIDNINNPGKGKLKLCPLLSRNVGALNDFDEDHEPIIYVDSESTDKTTIYSPENKTAKKMSELPTESIVSNIQKLGSRSKSCTLLEDYIHQLAGNSQIHQSESLPNLKNQRNSIVEDHLRSTPVTLTKEPDEASLDIILNDRNSHSKYLDERSILKTKETNKDTVISDMVFRKRDCFSTSTQVDQLETAHCKLNSSSNLSFSIGQLIKSPMLDTNDLVEPSKISSDCLKLELEESSIFKPSVLKETASSDLNTCSSSCKLEEISNLDHSNLKAIPINKKLFSSSDDFLLGEDQCTKILNEMITTVDVLNYVHEGAFLPIDIGVENMDMTDSSMKSLESTNTKVKVNISELFTTDESVPSSNKEPSLIGNENVIPDTSGIEKNVDKNIIDPMEFGESSESHKDDEMVQVVMSLPKKALRECTAIGSCGNAQMSAIACGLKIHFKADIMFDSKSNTYQLRSKSFSVTNQPSFLIESRTFKDIEVQTDVTSSLRSISVETLTEISFGFRNTPSVSNFSIQTHSSNKTKNIFEAPPDITLSSKSVGTITEIFSSDKLLEEIGNQTDLTMSHLESFFQNIDHQCTSENVSFSNLKTNFVALPTSSKEEGLDLCCGSIPENLSPMFASKNLVAHVAKSEKTKKPDNTNNNVDKVVVIRSTNISKDENLATHHVHIEDQLADNEPAKDDQFYNKIIATQNLEGFFQTSPFTNENITPNENNPSVEKIPTDILARFFSQPEINDSEETEIDLDFDQSIDNDSKSSDYGENGHDTKLEDGFLQNSDSFVFGNEDAVLFDKNDHSHKPNEKPVEMNEDEFVQETDDLFRNDESNDPLGITTVNEVAECKSPIKAIEIYEPMEEILPDSYCKKMESRQDSRSPESPFAHIRRTSRLSRKKSINKSFSSSNSDTTKTFDKSLACTRKSPLKEISKENPKNNVVFDTKDYSNLSSDASNRQSPLKKIREENEKILVKFDTTDYRDLPSDESSSFEDAPTYDMVSSTKIDYDDDDEDSLTDCNERLQKLLKNNYRVRDDDPSMKAAESTVAALQSSLMKRNVEQHILLRKRRMYDNFKEPNAKRLGSSSSSGHSSLMDRKEKKKIEGKLKYNGYSSDTSGSLGPATRKFQKNRIISDSESESEPEIPLVVISTDGEIDTPRTAMKKVLDNIQADLNLEVVLEERHPSMEDDAPNVTPADSKPMDYDLEKEKMEMEILRKQIAEMKSRLPKEDTLPKIVAIVSKKVEPAPFVDETPKNSPGDGSESDSTSDSLIPPTPPSKVQRFASIFQRF